MNTHPGMEPNFTSKPMHSGVKFNLDRFITKGHEINKCSLDNQITLMNSREEWGNRGILRLKVNNI